MKDILPDQAISSRKPNQIIAGHGRRQNQRQGEKNIYKLFASKILPGKKIGDGRRSTR
jgi:hypothetical protein